MPLTAVDATRPPGVSDSVLAGFDRINFAVFPEDPSFRNWILSTFTAPTLLKLVVWAGVPLNRSENVPDVVGVVDQLPEVLHLLFVPLPNHVVIVPADAVLATTMPISVKSVSRSVFEYMVRKPSSGTNVRGPIVLWRPKLSGPRTNDGTTHTARPTDSASDESEIGHASSPECRRSDLTRQISDAAFMVIIDESGKSGDEEKCHHRGVFWNGRGAVVVIRRLNGVHG